MSQRRHHTFSTQKSLRKSTLALTMLSNRVFNALGEMGKKASVLGVKCWKSRLFYANAADAPRSRGSHLAPPLREQLRERRG